MDLKKLGTIIRNKREEIGIPPSTLAAKVGIARPTLWIFERGENPKTGKPSRPSKDKLERIAEVLRMSQAETEELLSLAGYKVTNQPHKTANRIPTTLQTGVINQDSPSPATTITEIHGTVYLVNNGYLLAFDAKTGKRLWSSPTEEVSPLLPEQASVVERMKADIVEAVIHALEHKVIEAGIARPGTGTGEQRALEVTMEELPPLEYSELQAAFPRRRRRRRSGAVNLKTGRAEAQKEPAKT